MSVECNLEVWYIVDDVEFLTQNRPEYMGTLVLDKESLERTCEIWRRHLTPVHTDTSKGMQGGKREWGCLFQVLHSHIGEAKRICLRSSSKQEARHVRSIILKALAYYQDNPTLPECSAKTLVPCPRVASTPKTCQNPAEASKSEKHSLHREASIPCFGADEPVLSSLVERVVSALAKHELHLEQQFACLERKLSQEMSERMSIVEIKLGHMIAAGLGRIGSLETEVQSVGNIDVEVLPGTCSSIQVHNSPRAHQQSF